jgi:transcription initiation factor TFIIB
MQQRFCSGLKLPARIADLASSLATSLLKQPFCTRRNPVSISAACMYSHSSAFLSTGCSSFVLRLRCCRYLSCQLEEVTQTQSQVCRVANVTEVTLRKVFKELCAHISYASLSLSL